MPIQIHTIGDRADSPGILWSGTVSNFSDGGHNVFDAIPEQQVNGTRQSPGIEQSAPSGADQASAPAREAFGSGNPLLGGIKWISAGKSRFLRSGFGYLLLSLAAYVPVLRTHPGRLTADTKSYLYINPGGVMRQALYMWDSFIGNGTVTHQYIGYLFPMGPYFWAVQHLGIPMWIGQRIWLGSILFAAGAGVAFLLRQLGLSGPGRFVASLAFMLSPYILSYSARLSALLLPWSAIGWLVAFVLLALRRGGWRYPALFALVVAITGSVNATSLIYAGFAPLVMIPYLVWITKECSLRRAMGVTAKIALLCLAVSFWWIVGLVIEFSYALNIVEYTESIVTVTLTSFSSEVVRGLGYWFFYGEDQIDNYVQAAPPYMTSLWLLVLSFLVPAFQLALGVIARWRYRAYFAFLVLIGAVLAVGAYPYQSSTPYGATIKALQSTGIAGLALRSDNRAVPVLLLGLAGLTASGLNALWSRWRLASGLLALLMAGAVAANIPSLWDGNLIGTNLLFPAKLPAYYTQEANYLNSHNKATRVLDEPGDDFAYYQWGTTIDPVDPALLTRPFVAREQVPYGSAASADLLNALDETLQEQTFNPTTIAPIARLMSVGDLILRSDLAYERYNTPRPKSTWQLFNPSPPGLSAPIFFGKPAPAKPQKYPLIDETNLAESPALPNPPPLADFKVSNTRPIVRTEPQNKPILLDGDGMGMVSAAGAGLLANNPTIFYSPTFAKNASLEKSILNKGAALVISDTNYLAQRRWGSLRENIGYIQQPGEPVLVNDPTSHQLPVFPLQTHSDQTVAILDGVKHVTATSYGNPISFVPENRPSNAIDGNLNTVWTTGAFENPVGQRIQIQLNNPVRTDHLVLIQPLSGPRDRFITRVTITLSQRGKSAKYTKQLNADSRTSVGQTIDFPMQSFSTLEIRIDRINLKHEIYFAGVSGVGFAEIGIPGVNLHEIIRMPEDLLSMAGKSSITHDLILLTNRRQAPPTPPRTDPELNITRQFSLPTSRTFSITGTARISSLIPDNNIDTLLGRPGSDGSGIVATSSGRLPGDLNARASMALDGNSNTAWMPGIGPQSGGWLQVNLSGSNSMRVFDHLDLQVIADGRHSVPTEIKLSSASGADFVHLPPVSDSRIPNEISTIPLDFPAISGNWFRLTIIKTRHITSVDYYSGRPVIEPVGIAELGIPGLNVPAVPQNIPSPCRSDLASIDGNPLYLRISGTSEVASSEQGPSLTVAGCGPNASGITLGPGKHILETANGSMWQFGMNINTLDLASAAGGGPLHPNPSTALSLAAPLHSAQLKIVSETPTSYRIKIDPSRRSYWLVLGQSLNKGWSATVDQIGGRTASTSLGAPTLIDGISNGWAIGSDLANQSLVISVVWTPQKYVLPSILISLIALLGCFAIVMATSYRRRHPNKNRLTGSDSVNISSTETRSRTFKHPVTSIPKRIAVAALTCGLISGFFVNPWLGIPIAGLVIAGSLRKWVRTAIGIAAPTFLIITAVYSLLQQASHRWHALFGWATHFQEANSLTWLAIVLLIAYVAIFAVEHPLESEPPLPLVGQQQDPAFSDGRKG